MPRAVVVGLARSGVGAARLLALKGYKVTVTDTKNREQLEQYLAQLPAGVDLVLGGHPEGVFDGAEMAVVSPGVPLFIGPLQRARAAGVRVIGELELAWEVIGNIPFYAITGTNGKSTAVSMLDAMMRNSGRHSFLGGNIGNSLCAEAARLAGAPGTTAPDCVVAEVSSFQLEGIDTFRPTGAAILNITPDHMDRYGSMQNYRGAKAKIALNQKGQDVLVLNADDRECVKVGEEVNMRGKSSPRVFYFSRRSEVNGVYLKGEKVCWDFRGSDSGELMSVGDIRAAGVHNIENAMAAAALALLSGCSHEAVARALVEFPGLAHRMEFVMEVDGISYVNDSKGTNVGAVLKSLESLKGKVVLIAGGRDKDGDFVVLADALREKARAVVLIGEAAGKMSHAFEGAAECFLAEGMVDAVKKASLLARGGDTVLLSPACASFDMFRDFEDRGESFRQAVRGL